MSQQLRVSRAKEMLSDDPEFNEWFCTGFDGTILETRDYNELRQNFMASHYNEEDGGGFRLYQGGLIVFSQQARDKACSDYRRENKGPFKAPLRVAIELSDGHRAAEKLHYQYCMEKLVLDVVPRFKSALHMGQSVAVEQSPYDGSEMRSIMIKHFSDPWLIGESVMTKLVYELRSDYCNTLTGAFV